MKNLNPFVLILVLSSLLTSCGSKKDIVYLQNVGGYETMSDLEDYELRFKEGDILGIYVSTLVPEASIPYNLVAASSQSGSSSAAQGVDYIIDSEGNIDFPVLGTVNVAGLTISEVKNLLKTKLVDGGHLKDPTINVRLKNFRVTVLGEVKNPGTFDVPGDRVSVLEAIGMAGDLSIKGRRDNVMIIRDIEGSKTYTRIDLTNKTFMKSRVFYLSQNDIVYVEPNKSAVSQSVLDNRITIGISILSLLITTTFVILN